MVETMIAKLRGVWVLCGLLMLPSSLFAHRLDEYLQASLVSFEPGQVRLDINLTPGVAVADKVLARIDRDHNGVISTNETFAYAEALRRDLVLRLDGRKLALKLTASNIPLASELRTGWGIIQMQFSASIGPLAPGSHRLWLKNRHAPRLSVYLFNAARPRSNSVQILRQKRNTTQSTGEIEFTENLASGESGLGASIKPD